MNGLVQTEEGALAHARQLHVSCKQKEPTGDPIVRARGPIIAALAIGAWVLVAGVAWLLWMLLT